MQLWYTPTPTLGSARIKIGVGVYFSPPESSLTQRHFLLPSSHHMTDDQQQFLTQDKFDELKKELEQLKTVRRKEIAESLEYARSLGDLSENAEYQEARDLQAATEERIRRLETLLKSAKIMPEKTMGTVSFGSTVSIQKEGEKESRTYQIVGSEEANMQERKISHLSPLGEALMGKKKGEEFVFVTPNGKQNYKVISVS